VDELCVSLSERRGRVLVLHSVDLPALPFGLWYDNGNQDHIICREGITGYYRDHVVLHEICHMLARDTAVGPRGRTDEEADGDPLSQLIELAMRDPYAIAQEEVAEMFASRVLKLAKQLPPVQVSNFERRAIAMFGAA
jgi:hypothetical protein